MRSKRTSGDFYFFASNRVLFFRLQEMVETLLAANASVDLSRSDGATALILASQVWGSMGLMGLVDLVGPKVGRWVGVTWKSLAEVKFFHDLEETSGPNIFNND